MISIIIITYNRKRLLETCITSLFKQEYHKNNEVIILDNGSNDGTDIFIHAQHKNQVIYIKNTIKINVSLCKQRALKKATGDKIAFIDDDCFADKNWLSIIDNSLNLYDCVGGPVLPSSEVDFPWWWHESLDWLIGLNRNPHVNYLPLGSNVAFRREVLMHVQLPGQKLNECTNIALPYIEDNRRFKETINLGFTFHRDPSMIVYHRISQERFKISNLIKRSYNEGYALVIWGKSASDFIYYLIAVIIDPIRYLFLLDLNCLFRMIVHMSYIYNYLSVTLQIKKNQTLPYFKSHST